MVVHRRHETPYDDGDAASAGGLAARSAPAALQQHAAGEIDEDVGPPLALVPVAPAPCTLHPAPCTLHPAP